MMARYLFVVVLATLLFVCGVPTAEGQDIEANLQGLTALVEDIDENIDDLEENLEDVADDVEDIEDEIENFGEGIEDMETDVEAVTAEVVNLRKDMKTTRSVLEAGQQKTATELKLFREEVQNFTQSVNADMQCVKEDIVAMKNTLEGELSEITHSFDNCTLQEGLLDMKDELQNDLGTLIQNAEDEVRSTLHNHTQNQQNVINALRREVGGVKEELKDFGTRIESLEEGLQTSQDNQTETHLEIEAKLSSLQRDMNSTLIILQELKNQLSSLKRDNMSARQFSVSGSCNELPPTSQSAYYMLEQVSEWVYCDMDRQSCGCGNLQGWMRVANIDMTDPNQHCPEGFRLRPATSQRMCEMITERGCTSVVFPTHNVQYSRVCGRVKAYQFGVPDAFGPYYNDRSHTLNDLYVEGVSITHGNSRNHIWTLVVTMDELQSFGSRNSCPCIKPTATYTGVVPPFIGNNYFCDTASRHRYQHRLFLENPLWDGEGCGPTSSCCQFNSPPWFCKKLPQPTTDNIEVRVCKGNVRSDEDILIEQVEMYVQ